MTDPIRAALERLIDRLDETTDPNGPVPAWSDSFYAARAALAQPAPPAEEEADNAAWVEFIQELARVQHVALGEGQGPRSDLVLAAEMLCRPPSPPAEGEVGELVAFLRGCADGHYGHGKRGRLMLTRAADLLEQHHPTPVPVVYAPTDEELLELADDSDMDRLEGERGYPDGTVIKEGCWEAWDHQLLAFARAVLAKYGTTPVPTPVPVSERLQQMEDLAADAVSALRYIEQSHGRLYGVGWDRVYEKADQLRPAYALPLPAGKVQP